VSDVLESRLALKVMLHHVLGRSVRCVPRRGTADLLVVLIVIVHVLLAHEVFGPLVLVRAAILGRQSA
jgi:hypothetical protein